MRRIVANQKLVDISGSELLPDIRQAMAVGFGGEDERRHKGSLAIWAEAVGLVASTDSGVRMLARARVTPQCETATHRLTVFVTIRAAEAIAWGTGITPFRWKT